MGNPMSLRALIFDVDGTLADTERDGHLLACNEAFATAGIPITWTWDEFKGMLALHGTGPRMRRALENLPPAQRVPDLDRAVADLVALKQRLYIEKYVGRLPLRPGVREVIEEALARDVKLAIVSASYEAQILALLRYHMPHAVERFRPVLGKGAGIKTLPDSPLYRRCLAELGTSPAETLAIEDSELGLQAALTVGLPCAVFYNDTTFGQDFRGAALVARSLEYFDLDRLAALCLPQV